MKSSTRRAFLDRFAPDLTPAGGKWRCTLSRVSATGRTAGRAVDALRHLVTSPIARVPVSLPRWLTPQ